MAGFHIRNVPEPVATALRERASRHGHSLQQELMEASRVDQAFYIYDTETVIRFISDSVQPIPTGSY